MSIDHDRRGDLPGSLGRRMRSAWSEATEWFAALTDDGPAGGRALVGSAGGIASEADANGNDATGAGGHDTGRPADRGAEEIVTLEERMIRLVGENGGEMRQAEIVTSVEWSESTVSRKLSKLESEGAISRYQIGREKLVFLPGNEPESLGSPWRDAAADAPQQA